MSPDTKCDSFSAVSDCSFASQHPSFPTRFPFSPTTSTYNILMKACGTDYFHTKALMVEMKIEGLLPYHISWSILMDIWGGFGNVMGVLQILRSMHETGIQPDVVAYTTAIKVTFNTLLRARSLFGSLQEVQQCLAIYQDMRKAGYKPGDYYLKLLTEEWCKGVIQNRSQDKGQLTSCDTAALGPQSTLLEKVTEHLQDGNADSLSIDHRGLSKSETRIMVLAVLRMIKEKYNTGNKVEDDLWIITEEDISGTGG